MSNTPTITTKRRVAVDTVPKDLQAHIKRYPKLSREQAGHLRHFHNLASQQDGRWNHMGTQEPMQEFLDAYRYQIATMTYASGLAHYHRLPALHGVFKDLHRRLIHKMLQREVWSYWFNTSMSGQQVDPDLKELRQPWADPIVRENIMYSGHLLLMVNLYAMLFDDDEFEQEGSLEFKWEPLFWGMGPEVFRYSARTLQDAIMREMERNGYIGVCCEPNMVFVVCNQFPIIALRYSDARRNTNEVDQLLERYRAAWEKKGGFSGHNGQFYTAWFERQDELLPSDGPSSTAWTSAYMNTWNSDFVKAAWDSTSLGHITNTPDLGIRFNVPAVGNEFRRLVQSEAASPTSDITLRRAKEIAKQKMQAASIPAKALARLGRPVLGYVVQWLSELGKTQELDAILRDADQRLQPVWERGGLFYRRNDKQMDEDLNWTLMDPFTGNSCIGHARLNVPDGQKQMYEKPWTRSILQSRPRITGVTLGDGVNFLRGIWDAEIQCLVLTIVSCDGQQRTLRPVIENLGEGNWKVYINGVLSDTKSALQGDQIGLILQVDANECEVLVVKEAIA